MHESTCSCMREVFFIIFSHDATLAFFHFSIRSPSSNFSVIFLASLLVVFKFCFGNCYLKM